jgi:hypothetical protein
MNDDERIESWAKDLGRVPPGFADRVMDAVRTEGTTERRRPAARLALRVALIAAASVVFLGRVAAVLALFVAR